MACENNSWTLTIAGRGGDLADAPADFADMLSLAKGFLPARIQAALRSAQPLTKVLTYRYPGGVWRRYDQMTHHPRGLVVLGDALCSLDPINGQGMTMATLHAVTLCTQLRRGNPVDPRAFYAAVAAITKPVWVSNVRPPTASADLARASISQRAVRWARRKILESAADDMVVTERLMRIANFVDPPKRLIEPAFLARVATHHLQQGVTRQRDTRSNR